MAKLYKVEFYLVDIDDFHYSVDINSHLEHVLQGLDCPIEISKVEESKDFEWNNDLRINNVNATKEDYEKYFKEGD